MSSDLRQAGARVAIAAYLHDLGKFAQRAQIEEAGMQADSDGNDQLSINKQEYCPQFKGRYSHIHAAYTAIALDTIEDAMPDIIRGDCYPFHGWNRPAGEDASDSMINAAARHHKPETFLQWIIATADRLASGFERSEFENYNRAEEGLRNRSYLTARMDVSFEHIFAGSQKDGEIANSYGKYRYPLKPLCPSALMPVLAEKAEPLKKDLAIEEYSALWKGFLDSLRGNKNFAIPVSHRQDAALWLDHFDSLWMTFTHAIPSATAAKVGDKFIPIPTDVSLFDHSRTTAALATALWRYHEESDTANEETRKALANRADFDEQKFLLIQGDLAGIQNFIFSEGGESNKKAAKLLRGRSAMVSLLTETAALKILDALELPSTSQVINAAGKFLILAPNTDSVRTTLKNVREEIDQWFLKYSYGRASLSLAWIGASCDDFASGNKEDSPFATLTKNLFSLLEKQKLQRLNLCADNAPSIFSEYLQQFAEGDRKVCPLDGKAPADTMHEGQMLSQLARDQIVIGDALTQKGQTKTRGNQAQRLLITSEKLKAGNGQLTLLTDLFGYYLTFVGDKFADGNFGNIVDEQALVRLWDLALPANADTPMFNGCARRFINGYVPLKSAKDDYTPHKYRLGEDGSLDLESGQVKPFDVLVHEDRVPINLHEDDINKSKFRGISALHTLKGDIDNLGMLFQQGMSRPSFARMASLSRQVNNFFTIYLPHLCETEFPNTYTVFAGGDDFFLIGPWRSQLKLASRMRSAFSQYVAHNPSITFSAGLYASKPGGPINALGEHAESALEKSKLYLSAQDSDPQEVATKNAVTVFDRTMSWQTFDELLEESEHLDAMRCGDYWQATGDSQRLSTGFTYGLLELANMADTEEERPSSALWRSYLAYRIGRLVERLPMHIEDREEAKAQKARLTELLRGKLAKSLEIHKGDYHVALYNHLYQFRD